MFITLENFASLSVTPFIDIKKYDILGVFADKGKFLGGLVGKKEFGSFLVTGLYLDKTIQRTKDSAKTLKLLLENLKKF